MKPHKHAELIKAWADGAEIEVRWADGRWVSFAHFPNWDVKNQYRIKPGEKKPVVRWLWANGDGVLVTKFLTEEEALGHGFETKLEWSRTEFSE